MKENTWTNKDYPMWKNAAYLYQHCFLKGIQLGSVIGVVAANPIRKLLAARKGVPYDIVSFAKTQNYSVLGGIIVGIGMCTMKVVKWENK
jgi:hypothetical protein